MAAILTRGDELIKVSFFFQKENEVCHDTSLPNNSLLNPVDKTQENKQLTVGYARKIIFPDSKNLKTG